MTDNTIKAMYFVIDKHKSKDNTFIVRTLTRLARMTDLGEWKLRRYFYQGRVFFENDDFKIWQTRMATDKV
jgi:hypothetical protein